MVRSHAAWALGEIARVTNNPAAIIEALTRALEEDPDESVRAEAQGALERSAAR
jgi:HEAT repeat protein